MSLRRFALLSSACLLAACSSPDHHRAPPPISSTPNGEPFAHQLGCNHGLEGWFKAADLNHDGVLDLAEFKADAARLFAAIDTDHDGYITSDEVEAMRRNVNGGKQIDYVDEDDGPPSGGGSPPGGSGGPPGGGGGHGGGGGGHHHGGGGQQASASASGGYRGSSSAQPDQIMVADTNLDNRVSPDEFQALAARRFQALDTGHTGRIDLARIEQICTPADDKDH